MAKDYIENRFRVSEKVENLTSYVHKSIPGYCVVVDYAKNMYVKTMETAVYVMNHMADFERKPLEQEVTL